MHRSGLEEFDLTLLRRETLASPLEDSTGAPAGEEPGLDDASADAG